MADKSPMMVFPKDWWRSKTIWVIAMTVVSGWLAMPEVVAVLNSIMGPRLVLLLVGLVAAVMRFISTSPIAQSPATRAAREG